MKINLTKKPINAVIIQGFPGFGLVGSISTEFLINHLNVEYIGNIWMDNIPPLVAIHNEEIVQPFGIFYCKDYNIVILHVVTNAKNIEWKISEAISELAKILKAKEILCIEGVNSNREPEKSEVFFYANKKAKDKLKNLNLKPLKEGIIVGVTSALILREKDKTPITCLFAETHTDFPDSKAAANVIKVLDSYLKLNVDYKPLLETAKLFEEKLKTIITQTKDVAEEQEKKNLSYFG